VATALAASGLHGLFRGNGWYPMVVLAVVLTSTVVGLALTQGRLARRLLPVLVAAALAELAVVVLAHRRAPLGVLPGPAAIRLLTASLRRAAHEINVLVVPVRVRPELALVAAVGVGVAAALTAYLAGTRRAGLAGVPLLALLIVPASVHRTHVGPVSFLLGGAGWLALLATETALRRDDEAVARPDGATPAGSATTTTAWRIAAVALLAGLAIPVLTPTLSRNLLDHGTATGSGDASVTIVPPLATVEDELHSPHPVHLLTVTATTATYLQLTALDTFTGTTFSLGSLTATTANQVNGALPPTGEPGPSTRVAVTVRASASYAEHYLALPYAATSVQVSGSWLLYDPTRTVFSTDHTTADLTYRAVGAVAAPTAVELAGSGEPDPGLAPVGVVVPLAADVDVPDYLLAPLRALALAHTAGAGTAFAAARDLQNWLDGPSFRYTLVPQHYTGPDALLQFLDTGRRGDCEQYATAMVALVRALGIPARVAVGFTPGTRIGPGRYDVTSLDAHAWPQVFFPTTGWLRFEPTPAAAGATQPGYTSAATGGGGVGAQPSAPASPTPRGGRTPAPAHSLATHERVPAEDPGGALGPAPAAAHRAAGSAWVVVLAGVVALGLGLTPAAVRLQRRQRRWRRGPGPAEQAGARWEELLDSARDLGLALGAAATPRALAARLAAALPAGTAAATRDTLHRLSRRVEQLRYSPAPVAGAVPTPAEVRAVIAALTAGAPRLVRLQARLAPPTTVRELTGLVTRLTADGLDRLDRLGQAGATLARRRTRQRA
jgi:transglutaminase-like putative cysteine protease